jgi:chitodextrinase
MAYFGSYTVGTGVTSTNISGLIPSTAYDVFVITQNTDGNYSPANRYIAVKTAAAPPNGPADPAGLNVDTTFASYPDAIRLRWSDADRNGGASIDYYKVTWDPPYGPAQPYIVTPDPAGDTISYIASLAANSRYTFSVAAVNTDGSMSPGYARVIGATSSNVGPRDPTNFRSDLGSPPTSNAVYLKWTRADTEGDANLSGYYITWQPPDGGGSTTAINYATNKAITGLSASTTYSFNIVAVDTSGNDSPGNYYVSASTNSVGGLQPPTNLRVLAVGQTSVDLEWNPAIASLPDVVLSNVIEAYDISGDFYVSPFQIASGSNTSNYTFTNLSANTLYRFSMQALSDTGSALGTNTVDARTSASGAPSDPSLNVVTESYNYITFDWTLSGDGTNGGADLSGFYINYFATPNGETHRRNIPGGATASNVTVFNLNPNTEYSFTIYAQNLSGITSPGSGNATKIGNTLPIGAPYAPSNVQAHPYIPATPSSVSVMWNSAFKGGLTNAVVTNHVVTIAPPDLYNETTFDVGEDTTITISNLEPNRYYNVAVKAINASGAVGNDSTFISLVTARVTGPQDVVGLRTNGVVTDDTVPIAWESSGDPLAGPPINGYTVTYDATTA